MFIVQQLEDFSKYRERFKEIATFCLRWNMKNAGKIGSFEYRARLIKVMKSWDSHNPGSIAMGYNKDFVIIPPNAEMNQASF